MKQITVIWPTGVRMRPCSHFAHDRDESLIVAFDDFVTNPHYVTQAHAVHVVDQEWREVGEIRWRLGAGQTPQNVAKPSVLYVIVEHDNLVQYHFVEDLVRENKGPLIDDTELYVPTLSD